jgi:hypothetical protein
MEKQVIAVVSSSIVVPSNKTTAPTGGNQYAPILLLALAALAAHHYSKKQMRGLKRKMMWQLLKGMFKNKSSLKKSDGNGMAIGCLIFWIALVVVALVLMVVLWGWGILVWPLIILAVAGLIGAGMKKEKSS